MSKEEMNKEARNEKGRNKENRSKQIMHDTSTTIIFANTIPLVTRIVKCLPYLPPRIAAAVFIVFSVALAPACSVPTANSLESAAAKAVKETAKYRQNAWVNTGTDNCSTWQQSPADTKEQAQERVKTAFLSERPELWAAVENKYADFSIDFDRFAAWSGDFTQPSALFNQKLGAYYFKCSTGVTAAGRQLWTNENLPDRENTLPLAVYQEPKITGTTADGENIKRVEFTVGWKRTAFGETLATTTTAFAALPKELQERLRTGLAAKSNNFEKAQPGLVRLRHYDDGSWRPVEQVYF